MGDRSGNVVHLQKPPFKISRVPADTLQDRVSFPASLSLLAGEHFLFWAGISGSCGPISDQ